MPRGRKPIEGSLSTDIPPLPLTKTPQTPTTTSTAPKKAPRLGSVLGKVVTSKEGRIVPNVAKRALALLGDSTTGNAEFLAVMAVDPNPPASIVKFMTEAGKDAHKKHSLARVAGDLGTPVAEVFLSYARGVKAIGHAQAIERVSSVLASKMEDAIESLMDQTVAHEVKCSECMGEDPKCSYCGGEGSLKILPKYWAFAQKQIYQLSGVIEASKGIQIQNNTTVAPKIGLSLGAGEFLGKLLQASDEAINPSITVEAIEVSPTPQNVLPEGHSEALGDSRSSVQQEAGTEVPS